MVWMTDISEEAIKRRAEEQLSAATAAMVTVGNIEAEQEAARKRAEKEAQKRAEEEAERAEEERRQVCVKACVDQYQNHSCASTPAHQHPIISP